LALTIKEACAIARISRGTLYKALQSGALPAKKLGAKTIILPGDLHSWLEALPPAFPTPKPAKRLAVTR
jgi:excisionase family DNA binding protein